MKIEMYWYTLEEEVHVCRKTVVLEKEVQRRVVKKENLLSAKCILHHYKTRAEGAGVSPDQACTSTKLKAPWRVYLIAWGVSPAKGVRAEVLALSP